MKFRIGAGMLVSVLLALAIGGYGVYQQRRQAGYPPVVEREVQGTTPRGSAPVPEFLLRHRAELALSDAQAQQIQGIADAYRKEVAPYQQRMQTAVTAYQNKLEHSASGQRVKLQQLQGGGGDVQQLSSVVATTRHAFWQQARAVLSAAQQARADGLAAQATLLDLR